MAKKIIITDSVDKKAVGVLQKAGYEVFYNPGMKADEIKKVIGSYHGLIVRSDTKVTPDMIELMNTMEVIGRAGAGVDNIDVEAATRKGIIVMNTPGGNTLSTAEHAMSLLLSLCRNIPQADASIKAGKWDRKTYKGTELYGKKIGVVGLGKIGREVAVRAKAFGMEVLGYDPILSPEMAAKIGVSLVTMQEIFLLSDFITFHVPLDENTRGLISKKTLALCKDGVKIINCARGGIVNEDDLLEGLNTGKVSGAALDVYEKEPPDFNHPLFRHPKVVTTPHLGASTEEAQEKVAIQIAEQIIDLFEKQEVRGAVNAAALEAIGNQALAPYVKLAEKLGALASQLTTGKVKKLNLRLYGELVKSANGLLTAAAVKGYLAGKTSDSVNLINSGFLANEAGLLYEETLCGQHPDYANLVELECTGGSDGIYSGTVFGNKELRIVRMNQFRLEMIPEGDLLVYLNIDKPGMLASVGKVLARNNINIAGLSLGRLGIGEEALTCIAVDSPLAKDVLAEIAAIEGVSDVSGIKL